MNDPLIGKVLQGAYRIDALIADGGMSRIYLAEQISLSRKIAVKMLLPGFEDKEFIDLFLREARINSQIAHPNVVSVFDFGADGDIVFLAMEYLDGGTLESIVEEQGGLTLGNTLWLMEQVCNAVDAAHQLGVIHRDLKPGNIMIARLSGDNTIAKVVDFGISKPMSEADLKHTQMGMVIGTPGYLAPEQIRGQRDIDIRADIYAVGAVLYFLLSGKRPFSGANRNIIMNNQLTGDLRSLTVDDVREADALILQLVIDKAMALEREDRYQTMAEMWADIQTITQQANAAPQAATASAPEVMYQLVFNGKVCDGFEIDSVKSTLAKGFKLKPTQLESMFSGKRIVVQKNLSSDKGEAFKKRFLRCGALVELEEMPGATVIMSQAVPTSVVSNAKTSVKSTPISVAELPHSIPNGTPLGPGSAPRSGVSLAGRGDRISAASSSSGIHDPRSASGFYSNSGFSSGVHSGISQIPETEVMHSGIGATPVSGPGTVVEPRKRGLQTLILSVVAGLLLISGIVYAIPDWRYHVGDLFVYNIQGREVPRGVSDHSIRIGLSAAFKGAAKELGRSMQTGIEARFKELNDAGGVHGRQLVLTALNDGYEPELAVANVERFLDPEKGVFAMLGNVGTPTASAILNTILEKQLILFAPLTGADLLRREPPDRYVFNYRASYADETAAIIKYFVEVKNLAPQQIAVLYQDDQFGRDGLRGVVNALDGYGVTLDQIATETYARNSTNVSKAVALMGPKAAEIEAIVIIGTYATSAEFTREMRALDYTGEFANVSFVGTNALAELFQEMGDAMGSGVIITQVVPMFDGYASGTIAYRNALEKYFPSEEPGFVSLEGYIAASIFIEALQNSGRYFDTESFIGSLESIQDLDLGIGSDISYHPSDHQGSKRVWGTVINAEGKVVELDLKKADLLQ